MARSTPLPPPPPQWVIDINTPPIKTPKPLGSPTLQDSQRLRSPAARCVLLQLPLLQPSSITPSNSFSEAAACLLKVRPRRPKGAHNRRDRHSEDQEGLGDRHCTCEAAADDWVHDVHVGQRIADLQHHDGYYGIQESNYGTGGYELGVCEV